MNSVLRNVDQLDTPMQPHRHPETVIVSSPMGSMARPVAVSCPVLATMTRSVATPHSAMYSVSQKPLLDFGHMENPLKGNRTTGNVWPWSV